MRHEGLTSLVYLLLLLLLLLLKKLLRMLWVEVGKSNSTGTANGGAWNTNTRRYTSHHWPSLGNLWYCGANGHGSMHTLTDGYAWLDGSRNTLIWRVGRTHGMSARMCEWLRHARHHV